MDFETRKSEAMRLVAKFLDDFVPPRGLSDEAQANRIASYADAFARKMPTKGDYAESIEAVLMKIRDTHSSNTWPSQADFISAMPAGEHPKFAKLEQFTVDRRDQLIELMSNGEAVDENSVWGNISASLGLSAGVLEGYRKSSAANWQNTYRSDAFRMMRDKYGPEVDLYFRQGSAA